ncbi:hypothetical protein [Cryobacterium fucosi]|uniref:DUF1376 domain-containing protein n=1 Tax=Cryobacterium fucosi TaxID=1259157 RepID=A0A4R9B3D1_9MICO|nr:hypothetical protein [Cryobacterium fucosi]TFD74714.1 hypothetical protein E3T48_12370 [Cryobacterium fucosi]
MARIRSIKPEFWDSPGTARASLRGRLFFIAMWNWADDWGVGDANPKRLVGFAFPNDDDVSAADFPTLRDEVADCFDVQFYEVDGRQYYSIPSWDEHQRTERKAKRTNPGSDRADSPVITRESENPVESVGTSDAEPRKIDRGNRGKGTGEEGKGNVADIRPDVSRLCNLLADLIESNGSKRPSIGTGWLDAARLLVDVDKRPLGEAVGLIQWCQGDAFWRANILSMPKFREKYDTLRLQRESKLVPTGDSVPEENVTALRIAREHAEQKADWCEKHGVTEAEYDANCHDRVWLARVESRVAVNE